MATFSSQKPEEGRPPESKIWHNKINFNNDNNNFVVQDINRNINNETRKNRHHQTFPKILRLKRQVTTPPPSPPPTTNALITLNVSALNNNLALCASSTPSTTGTRKNRNSLHQNVEEALSSLLWQPYEYQNKSTTSNVANRVQQQQPNASSSSLSTCSCCSSRSSVSSTFDLDETANNSPLERYADLYLRHEMVNNLAGKNAVHQSPIVSTQSHDHRSQLSTSRLSGFVDVATSSTECSRRGNTQTTSSSSSPDTIEIVCYGDASEVNKCDVNDGSDMQLEVSGNVSCCAVPPPVQQHGGQIVNITTGTTSTATSDKTISTAPYVFNKSTTVPNLSSANVVGLPNHPRYGSVPCSTSTVTQNRHLSSTGNNLFPNHPRNGSEPSATYTNQFRFSNNNISTTNNNNNNIVPIPSTNYQRNNSNDLQFITHHMRSSSAPKSLPIQRYDNVQSSASGTVSTTTTSSSTSNISRINSEITHHKVPQSSSNVSNVNVNFYRAVPVNVVSSVPTIHCLNTLSSTTQHQGNNISNVQIMPLGTNTPSHFLGHNNNLSNNNNVTTYHNTPPSTTNIVANGGGGTTTVLSNVTTQVTVHSPVNQQTATTNSIQIPSQIHNNSVVRTGTATINNQVPTNCCNNSSQVIIQNNRQRTFTSTEAQTDEIAITAPPTDLQATVNSTREQRRRERRERRHQRRINNASNHRHTVDHATQANTLQNDTLPDLLNSHLPPPYSAVAGSAGPPPPPPPPSMVPPQIIAGPPPPPTVLQTVVPNSVVPSGFAPFPAASVLTGQVPLVQTATPVPVTVTPPSGFRFPFPAGGFRRGRFSEEPPKSCCGLLSWKPGSLRWFIALIALVAVCCVLVGTALGAMRPAGRDHLTVSLLMIGVGIVLVTVSGVAWRLTSHDSSTCRSMLGLGSTESVDVCSRRFVPRLPPSYGRPHHPYAAMMYPEFQYRPPPPSYQASMQEYRLRLLLLDRGNTPQIQAGLQNAISPPPTYRSHAGSLLRAPLSNRRDAALSEYSCPPSYRSQNSTANRQHTLSHHSAVLHSREQSLSISETNSGEGVVNVVNILASADDDIALDNITLDSLKMEPDPNDSIRMLPKDSTTIDELEGTKDGNLVTIVQTSDQSPVIVTVSGSSQIDNTNTVQITEIPSEMEILAHL